MAYPLFQIGTTALAGISGLHCADEADVQAEKIEQKPPKFAIAGNIAVVSDYVFRGVSLSDNDFALQGGFNLSAPHKINAGIWASSIETLGGSELEWIYSLPRPCNWAKPIFPSARRAISIPAQPVSIMARA